MGTVSNALLKKKFSIWKLDTFFGGALFEIFNVSYSPVSANCFRF